jgi:hypothetical protein
MSDLIYTHGEGIKVTLYYWFPEVELLLPVWFGHLQNEDEVRSISLNSRLSRAFARKTSTCPAAVIISSARRSLAGCSKRRHRSTKAIAITIYTSAAASA